MRHINSVRWMVGWLAAGILTWGMAQPAAGQALIKVHKDKITVSAPSAEGVVRIEGAAGAIESTSSVVSLTAINLSTTAKVPATAAPDGSFQVELLAAAQQRVRVEARNQEGKRSIGTFVVPALDPDEPAAAWKTLPVPAGEPTATAEDDSPEVVDRRAGGGNLAVLVLVIDMGKGELLAAERVVGVPRARMKGEQLYLLAAENIIRRCVAAIQSELRPTVGLDAYERPSRMRQTPPSPPETAPGRTESKPAGPAESPDADQDREQTSRRDPTTPPRKDSPVDEGEDETKSPEN
ncbi:MAG: hypothetical protein JW810_14025 [Sedimentisphaerales bacterium]|nr:hypothetical protein [Sedimentisphaerales bacterium]